MVGFQEHEPSLGTKYLHPMGYFSQTFLLMRGAFMQPKWVDLWKMKVGKKDKFA